MKNFITIIASGILVLSGYANTTNIPAESKSEANVETEVDVDKNVFTGSKTVKTTKTSESESSPGVKSKKYSKNVKKYDKNGNLIKNETETEGSTKKND